MCGINQTNGEILGGASHFCGICGRPMHNLCFQNACSDKPGYVAEDSYCLEHFGVTEASQPSTPGSVAQSGASTTPGSGSSSSSSSSPRSQPTSPPSSYESPQSPELFYGSKGPPGSGKTKQTLPQLSPNLLAPVKKAKIRGKGKPGGDVGKKGGDVGAAGAGGDVGGAAGASGAVGVAAGGDVGGAAGGNVGGAAGGDVGGAAGASGAVGGAAGGDVGGAAGGNVGGAAGASGAVGGAAGGAVGGAAGGDVGGAAGESGAVGVAAGGDVGVAAGGDVGGAAGGDVGGAAGGDVGGAGGGAGGAAVGGGVKSGKKKEKKATNEWHKQVNLARNGDYGTDTSCLLMPANSMEPGKCTLFFGGQRAAGLLQNWPIPEICQAIGMGGDFGYMTKGKGLVPERDVSVLTSNPGPALYQFIKTVNSQAAKRIVVIFAHPSM
jgi:hypothetical protein